MEKSFPTVDGVAELHSLSSPSVSVSFPGNLPLLLTLPLKGLGQEPRVSSVVPGLRHTYRMMLNDGTLGTIASFSRLRMFF